MPAPSLSPIPAAAHAAAPAPLAPDQCRSLLDDLALIADPRRRRGRRHPLVGVLGIAVCAVLAGARSLAAIGEWAADAPGPVLAALGVRRDPWTQGLGKVPECRFHGLVMPRGARAPAVLGRSIRPSVNDGRAPGRSQPEPGHDGTVASVISACGPVERFCDEVEACAGHLLDVTGSLSVKPGHPA